MSQYEAPGVYIEDGSFRPPPIEGASTATTGFVGPTRDGPTVLEPPLITSLAEFERTYGGMERLEFAASGGPVPMDNYMWHAARAFFAEGGRRLYVSRVQAPNGERPTAKAYDAALAQLEKIDDISIVAAPGSTFGYEGPAYGASS